MQSISSPTFTRYEEASRELTNRRESFRRYALAYATVPSANLYGRMECEALLLQTAFTNLEDLAAKMNQE